MLNNLLQMHLKLFKKKRFKKQKTGDLIDNKIADRVTKISKTLPKKNLETNEEEILRERFTPPEVRYKIIDDLRLEEENY